MILQALIVSLSVAAVSCNPLEMSSDNMLDVLSCMKTHGVEMDDLENVSNELSKKQICFFGCTVLKKGFNKDAVVSFDDYSNRFDEEEKAKVRECFSGIKSTDDCTMGQEFIDCQGKAKK